uniref:Cytochrome c biogenesis protein Ccs1 n=1 Tax=Dipterosiphonia australica TaxID=2007208 RepID=A0A1Z1MLM3_9FLOR|nr:cytochrome c biogenesis protein ccs1 [Dipterosiphonia australica]ARW66759.1 cytochrome c biogenesis protein ccs1 [Dipterosiphonia australica]
MNKNFFWKSLKRLANLNFSIFILSTIIICCFLGSIIEQDKNFVYYEINYPKYNFVINFLGIDHIFSTWWFILILTILIFSLIACTFSTQLPSLKNARRWKFIYKSSDNPTNKFFLKYRYSSKYSFINIIYSLVRLNFFVFYRNGSIYSYKGLYGRIAPVFVHCSIIAILIGSLISVSCGFVVQEIVPQGEIFHFKNILHAGFCSNLPLDIFFRVNHFSIKYNSNGSIGQFLSVISVYLQNQIIFKSKIISVNNPLNMRSITIYQTDWQIMAMRIGLGENLIIQQRIIKTNINGKSCWLSSFRIDENNQIFFLLFSLDSQILICDNNGLILNRVNLNEKFYVNNVSLKVYDVMTNTGLQAKIDPGIVIVYFGFFIMMLSTFISYISYSQIWIYGSLISLQFLGSTNRASLFFEQDISYLNVIYSYYLKYITHDISKVNNVLM